MLVCLSLFSALVAVSEVHSQDKFYNYYENGLQYLEKGDWLRAVEELKSAVSLEFEDSKQKRTYGTRFIQYLPHFQLGKAHLALREYENARRELELSLAYVETKPARELLSQLGGIGKGEVAAVISEKPAEEIPIPKAKEPEVPKEEPKPTPKAAAPETVPVAPPRAVPPAVFEPSRVTQVGSRLAIAVMPLEAKGDALQFEDLLTEKLLNNLVNMRRFRVIERASLDKILKEQALGMSGVVDEALAVEVGRVAGADAIVVGSIIIAERYGKVSVRVISVETSETIVAEEADTKNTKIESLEEITEKVASGIYNALPLVEGNIIEVDGESVFLDIGFNMGLRKGTKCIAYSEGKQIVHPVTGEIIGKRNKKLAELVITEVQERMSVARVVENAEGQIAVGNKVVVK